MENRQTSQEIDPRNQSLFEEQQVEVDQQIGVEAGQSYSFVRANGLVEHAENAADAIKRCPVLGSMPMEQANVLLDLASIGNKIMAEATTKSLSSQKDEKQAPGHVVVDQTKPLKSSPEHKDTEPDRETEDTKIELEVLRRQMDAGEHTLVAQESVISSDAVAQQAVKKKNVTEQGASAFAFRSDELIGKKLSEQSTDQVLLASPVSTEVFVNEEHVARMRDHSRVRSTAEISDPQVAEEAAGFEIEPIHRMASSEILAKLLADQSKPTLPVVEQTSLIPLDLLPKQITDESVSDDEVGRPIASDFADFAAEAFWANERVVKPDIENSVTPLGDFADYPLIAHLDFDSDPAAELDTVGDDEIGLSGLGEMHHDVTAESTAVAERVELANPAENEQLTIADWAAELHKQPDEIFSDFSDALQLFGEFLMDEQAGERVDDALSETESAQKTPSAVEPTVALPRGEQNLDSQTEFEARITPEEVSETVELPAILTVATERLHELAPAEKATTALIMKDIIGAIHGIKILQARQAEPEVINAIEAQLEEICITFFETLGIEYTDTDVTDFVQIIVDTEFKLPHTVARQAKLPDLEHDGTREAKSFAWLVNSRLSDVASRGHRIVGALAVFAAHAAGSTMPVRLELAPSYTQAV